MNKNLFIVSLTLVLFILASCNNSNQKYMQDINLAYDSLNSYDKETIKNWKKAEVLEYTPSETLEIMDNDYKLVDIKDTPVIRIIFKTTDDETLGPITIYIHKESKKIIGTGIRK
ncbi:hypothetical protein ACFSCX_16155 [Bacillus salitolerans]|uniref:DUF3887 domain-containing protein n=1 Tax=Bacillus salitolerans TaxID=1437434 RepID=A0ABW4LTG2_9BACI